MRTPSALLLSLLLAVPALAADAPKAAAKPESKVTVHKPQAPIEHNFRDVAVTVKGRNG
mgnify:CR=1 FL=1